MIYIVVRSEEFIKSVVNASVIVDGHKLDSELDETFNSKYGFLGSWFKSFVSDV